MIIDRLTANEKEAIKNYISSFAFEEDPFVSSRKPIDYILRFWDKEKETLYKMLNSQMILSKEVLFKKGEEELYEDMNKTLLRWDVDSNVKAFVDEWKDLYCWGGPYYGHHGLQYLMYPETLVDNYYDNDTFTLEISGGKSITINRGMKAIRAIGKIATALNLPCYEEFRQAHSQVLNQKRTKGNLCLSIHPLDFMTMSDNDCGWDSCMNWRDGGDYRRGTVEVMNSPIVVLAYLASEKEMRLFPYQNNETMWNNKKWREIFVVTPEIITGIKGYPYCNEHLEKAAADWIKELAEENLGWTYFNNMVEWDNFNSVTNEYFPMGLAVRAHSNAMYNDCSSHQKAYFSEKTPIRYEFNYSGVSECMCCGEANYFDEPFNLVCDSCEASTHCEYCDDRIRGESHIVDGIEVCTYCYEEHTDYCALCEEVHLTENMMNLHLAKSPTEVYRYIHVNICENGDCLDRHGWTNINIHEKYIRYYGSINYVLINDLTNEQLEIFDSGSRSEILEEEKYFFSNEESDF